MSEGFGALGAPPAAAGLKVSRGGTPSKAQQQLARASLGTPMVVMTVESIPGLKLVLQTLLTGEARPKFVALEQAMALSTSAATQLTLADTLAAPIQPLLASKDRDLRMVAARATSTFCKGNRAAAVKFVEAHAPDGLISMLAAEDDDAVAALVADAMIDIFTSPLLHDKALGHIGAMRTLVGLLRSDAPGTRLSALKLLNRLTGGLRPGRDALGEGTDVCSAAVASIAALEGAVSGPLTDEARENACILIMQLASECPPNQARLVETHAVEALVGLLKVRGGVTEPVAACAAAALAKVADGVAEARQRVVDLNAVAPLCKLVGRGRMDTVFGASKALLALLAAEDLAGATALMQIQGAHDDFLEALFENLGRGGADRGRRGVAGVLEHLAGASDDVADALIHAGGVRMLQSMLDGGNWNAKAQAARTLAVLMRRDKVVQALCGESIYLSPLVHMLGAAHRGAVEGAALALKEITYMTQVNSERVLRARAVPLLVQTISSGTPLAVTAAARTLAQLSEVPESRAEVLRHDPLPGLVALLGSTSEPERIEAACSTLALLAEMEGESVRAKVHELGAVPQLVAYMRPTQTLGVRAEAARACGAVSLYPAAGADLLGADAVNFAARIVAFIGHVAGPDGKVEERKMLCHAVVALGQLVTAMSRMGGEAAEAARASGAAKLLVDAANAAVLAEGGGVLRMILSSMRAIGDVCEIPFMAVEVVREGGLEWMIRAISIGDTPIKGASLRAIAAASKVPQLVDYIVSAGAVAVAADVLREGSLRREVAAVIAAVARPQVELRDGTVGNISARQCVALGIVPLFADMIALDFLSDIERAAACDALSAIAMDKEKGAPAMNCKAVYQVLIHALDCGAPDLQAAAAGAVASVCTGSESLAKKFTAHGTVGQLVDLVEDGLQARPPHDRLLGNAVGALSAMCWHQPAKVSIVEEGGLKSLVRLVGHSQDHPLSATINAVECLRQLAMAMNLQGHLVRAGAIKALSKCMRVCLRARGAAAGALRALAADNAANKLMIIEAGALNTMVAIIEGSMGAEVTWAVAAIASLCVLEHQAGAIVASRAVPPLLDLAREGDPREKKSAIKALSRLAMARDGLRAIQECGGGDVLSQLGPGLAHGPGGSGSRELLRAG